LLVGRQPLVSSEKLSRPVIRDLPQASRGRSPGQSRTSLRSIRICGAGHRCGDVDAVHEVRRSFQSATEDEFRAIVEKATGRKVIAYMSMIHDDPDLAVELFVLEPVADAGAPSAADDMPV